MAFFRWLPSILPWLVTLVGAPAHATVCGVAPAASRIVAGSAPIVQSRTIITPRLATPQVFYGVGHSLREEMLLRLLIREELQRALAGLNQSGTAPQGAAEPTSAVLTLECGKCHMEGQARGGVSLEGVLSADLQIKAIREMAEGRMPPGKTLQRESKNALLSELLRKGE